MHQININAINSIQLNFLTSFSLSVVNQLGLLLKIELRTDCTQEWARISRNGFLLKGRLVVVVVGCVCEQEALFTAEMLLPSAHVPFCTKEARLLLLMSQPTLS